MATNRRDRLVGLIIACVMCIPFLAIGIWGLRRGCSAWTLSKDPQGDVLIWAFFALAGLWGLLFALAHAWENCPNAVHACLWSFFLLILGSPFLYVGITRPEQIQGTVTITGLGADVSHTAGSTLGGVVFVLVGVACFGAIPFVWRGFMKRGLLKKFGNEEKNAEPGVGR
ncbi:MAG: hypothetical protein WCI20_09970 [bacterium]